MTRYLLVNIIILVALVGCEEKLPPRVEPTNVLVGVLECKTKRTGICTNGLPQFDMTLMVGVRNDFDETLEGAKHVKINLSISSFYEPSIRQTVTFESSSTTEFLRIDPGATLWFELKWDHRDGQGNLIWKALKLPSIDAVGQEVKFRAIATIQVFEKIQTVPTSEQKFSVVYFLNPKC